MDTMDTVVLRGSPQARGIQQGRALRERIQEHWELYRTQVYPSLPEAQVRPILANMLGFLQERFPEVLEELEGIAQGAGLDFEAVARVNFGGAIAAIIYSNSSPATGCSCVAFTDSPDGAIIGKNTDSVGMPELHYVLKIVVPDRGVPYIGYGDPGGPWVEAAINTDGLAIGQASSSIQRGQDGRGMPILHSLHLTMQYTSRTWQAVDFLGGIIHAGKCSNLMIADAEGEVVALERGYDRQVVRMPEDGHLFFTNHVVSAEMQTAVIPSASASSMGRLERYQAIFANECPAHTIEGLRRVISDHGRPASPCGHPGSEMCTRYACILVPRRREMRLYRGPACSTPPESYFI